MRIEAHNARESTLDNDRPAFNHFRDTVRDLLQVSKQELDKQRRQDDQSRKELQTEKSQEYNAESD